MPTTTYKNKEWTSKNLVLEGDGDLQQKATQMLDQIYSLKKIGPQFLKDLNAANKITIAAGSSFRCVAGGDGQYILFKKYVNQADHLNANNELEWAIDYSPFKNNLLALPKQLAQTTTVLMTHALTPKQLRSFKLSQQEILMGYGGGLPRVFTPSMDLGTQLEVVASNLLSLA